MDTTASPRMAVDQSLVARVVSSYINKNQLSPADTPALIQHCLSIAVGVGETG
jgi:predicted transcriptional regulator